MSPLQLTLLFHTVCSYLCLVSSLPVTSKPLANTPDHLTWEAWLMVDSKNPSEHEKTRKITPKSIFIAPDFNNISQTPCRPGYTLDRTGQCIQTVNINPFELLQNTLQSLVSSSNTQFEDDYDYDLDDPSNGPYQVNIPLSIDTEAQAFKADYEMVKKNSTIVSNVNSQNQPFRVGGELEASSSTEQQIVEFDKTATATIDDDDITTTILPSSPESTTRFDKNVNAAISAIPSLVSPSPLLTLLISNKATNLSGMASEELVESKLPINNVTSIVKGDELPDYKNSSSTQSEENKMTVNLLDGVSSTTVTMELDEETDKEVDAEIIEDKPISQLVTENNEALQLELQKDDLVLDIDSYQREQNETNYDEEYPVEDENTTMPSIETTTSFFDGLLTTLLDEESNTEVDSSTEIFDLPTTTTTETLSTHKNMDIFETEAIPAPSEKRMIIITDQFKMGTNQPVHIVTPIPNIQTTTPKQPSSQHMEKDLLGVVHETELNKKLRETIMQQEQKEAAIENIDSNNRFIYHHLTSPSTDRTSQTETTTEKSPHQEQFKVINRNAERPAQNYPQYGGGHKFRFPNNNEDLSNPSYDFRSDLVRFPGPSSHRLPPANMNRLIPEALPKKSTESHQNDAEKPPFWWLPPGWEVDRLNQKPMLLRFWSRMPLVRDTNWRTSTPSSAQTTSSISIGRSYRENSKSPSENLYKEISAQDIYKVLESRHRKHSNS